MSGGSFHYNQYKLEETADEIDKILVRCCKHKGTYKYNKKTIAKFIETRDSLERTAKMVHRVDWLVSGDDSEKDFHSCWKEEGLGK